jgi:hypothetical protein
VLPTVARWFVPDARETVDNLVQVWAALRCVHPTSWCGSFVWRVTREFSSTRDARELSKWLRSEMFLRGCPLGLIYSIVGRYMQI